MKSHFFIGLSFLSNVCFAQADQIRNLKKSELRKPSLTELRSFLSNDKTKDHVYDRDKFNCVSYSLELRDNARDLGFSAGHVSITFADKSIGHDLNVFDVPGEGLIYIEPQNASVAYVEKGEVLGFIPLTAVHEEFIELPEQADQFYQELKKKKYEASLFSYAYFKVYQSRRAFLKQTIAKYNLAVDVHNANIKAINAELSRVNEEVRRYNKNEPGTLRLEEIHDMQDTFKFLRRKSDVRKLELDQWNANISLLQDELKEDFQVMPELDNFVIYW